MAEDKAKREIGVGMPAFLYLEEFGSQVWHAFGHLPYLVGTALVGKEWRDVDVRLILSDEEYFALFGERARIERTCGKWVALCLAFSALGKQMTGLPIDFQIQQQTKANEQFKGQPRQGLGYVALRMAKHVEEPP